ncbi:MAG: hypothetical protein ACRCX2_03155 [Paraclostridium sp.]
MKLKKVFATMMSSILMLTGCFLTTGIKAHANELNNEDVVIELSSEEIEKLEDEQIRDITSSYSEGKTDGWEYDWRPTGSAQSTKANIGYAGNQPIGGTVFNSPGGFFWQDGGSNKTVSISVGYGTFSVSVPLGKVTGSSGQYISSPWTKVPVKLHVAKDIKVQKYNVYRKPKYGGQWQFYKVDYTKIPYRNHLSVRKV